MSEAYITWQMENYGNVASESDTYLDEEILIQEEQRKFEAKEDLWIIEQE